MVDIQMQITKLSKAEFNKVRYLFEANYPNLAFVYAFIEDKTLDIFK